MWFLQWTRPLEFPLNDMESKRFSLNKQDLISIAKGLGITLAGAALTYLSEAIVKIDKLFQKPTDPRLVLTVHDSLVFEVPYGEQALDQLHQIKQVMEGVVQLKVPMPADCKIGTSLGNMVEMHL